MFESMNARAAPAGCRAAHRPPAEDDDPEPGLPPIDPDDGIANPWTPADGDGDLPLDPAP